MDTVKLFIFAGMLYQFAVIMDLEVMLFCRYRALQEHHAEQQ
jgi:hypothetical protein